MKEAPRSYADMIEELQAKIRTLEDENRLLRDRLCEAGISYIDVVVDHGDRSETSYDTDQCGRIKKFEITDKIANDFL